MGTFLELNTATTISCHIPATISCHPRVGGDLEWLVFQDFLNIAHIGFQDIRHDYTAIRRIMIILDYNYGTALYFARILIPFS